MDSLNNRDIILNSLKKYSSRPDSFPKSETIINDSDTRDELYETFFQTITAAGAAVYQAQNTEEALEKLENILLDKSITNVVMSEDDLISDLGCNDFLKEKGVKISGSNNEPNTHKHACFSVDAGITGADYVLTDTGTIVIRHNNKNARLLSLAPPIHIAFINYDMFLPDIETFVTKTEPATNKMPSAITFISGPSMTADICMTATYGMHGPKELHVICIKT